MNDASIECPKCKTGERIAHEYCCQDFRDADIHLDLFHYSAPKYYICSPKGVAIVMIDYCPWCTKQIP